MRVRCRAAPDRRSNAVGRLELESTPEGLWIAYESVSRYREGYAPGPAAVPAEHRVPWRAVRVTRVGAEHLRLEVQEPLSPFAHFYLRDFTRAEPARWIARARPWGRLSSPQVVLTEFCHALEGQLGAPVDSEMALPAGLELGANSSLRRVPRTAVAFAIVFAAGGLAALMLGKAPLVSPLAPAASVEIVLGSSATAAPASSVLSGAAPPPRGGPELSPAPVPDPPSLPPPLLGGGCECIRHESVLWQRPPPRLTALVTRRQPRTHAAHQHLEIELAVVNNGERDVENLTVGVRFQIARPGPPGSNDAPVQRSLSLPGSLGPGHQVSWKVEGRGDRFELQVPDLGRLDEDGLDAAPVDSFISLADRSGGGVRLHAGMMLAFLGDARARAMLQRLRPGLSANELVYLDRLLDTTADLQVCQLRVSAVGKATRIQSCLYNAGEQPLVDFELLVRALRPTPDPQDPGLAPPETLADELLSWSGTLGSRRGRRLELTLNLPRTEPPSEHWLELIARHKESAQ
ncbi:MAG: hypothetical protein ABI895_16000 [Deltaproteobacteria bacterium]